MISEETKKLCQELHIGIQNFGYHNTYYNLSNEDIDYFISELQKLRQTYEWVTIDCYDGSMEVGYGNNHSEDDLRRMISMKQQNILNVASKKREDDLKMIAEFRKLYPEEFCS